jgi:Domain of unknown function (DUF4287)/Domain of unknown function (DUF5655)
MASVEDGLRTQIANIERSSGKTMAEWRAAVHERGLARHGEILALLKTEHGLSHGSANRVAIEVLKPDEAPTDAAAIDAIYAGRNAALRLLHDQIVELAESFGPDVELAPKKAWLSLRRTKQFATVGPASSKRLEVCLNLDRPSTGRLEAPTDAMLPRRVRLESEADVDAEFRGWLREAYDRS